MGQHEEEPLLLFIPLHTHITLHNTRQRADWNADYPVTYCMLLISSLVIGAGRCPEGEEVGVPAVAGGERRGRHG